MTHIHADRQTDKETDKGNICHNSWNSFQPCRLKMLKGIWFYYATVVAKKEHFDHVRLHFRQFCTYAI